MEPFFGELITISIAVLKKYSDFSGRARRKEYWMFSLAIIIVTAVLGILSLIPILGVVFTIVSGIFSLLILVPSLAVSFRRLHDTDRSGLWLLLCLTGIGAFVVLYFSIQEGTRGDNKYGPDPKAGA